MKPSEKAMPTKAIADDLFSDVLKSVIIAIDSETLAFVIPPIIRLNKNMMNKCENDQIMYDNRVPVFFFLILNLIIFKSSFYGPKFYHDY